jgi:NitT/TauT family transport system substrate-binding protein
MKYIKISFLALVILLTACNGKKTEKIKDETKVTEVTVAQWGQEKYLIYLPFYLAQERGFFEKQGLNIKVKYSGNDDQVFATVLKGEALLGIGDPIFTAIARENGAKGKVVASLVNGVSIWGVTKKDIPFIESSDDLKGLKLGTFPAPSTIYTLMQNTINDNNLENTKIVQAPIGSQIALIENDDADIAMELEPGASLAVSQGYKVVYSGAKFYGPFAFTGVTTTEENIANNKETIQKFVNALEQALVFARKSLKETIETAQALFPSLDKEIVANAVNRMITDKTIPVTTAMSNESWQNALKIRLQMGDIKNLKPTEDAVDNSFANNAVK